MKIKIFSRRLGESFDKALADQMNSKCLRYLLENLFQNPVSDVLLTYLDVVGDV